MTQKRVLPPLSALRAFEAAARHMSFKLAADEMHVTASAVSHSVAALEEFLDIKLFHRRTRKLLLTDAGSAYISPVSRAFEGGDEATREVSGRSHADILTVVCSPTFSRSWLMPRLGEFLDVHRDIDLRLHATMEAVLPREGVIANWASCCARMSMRPSSTARADGTASSSTSWWTRSWCRCALLRSAMDRHLCASLPT